jgi:hypothetical protein
MSSVHFNFIGLWFGICVAILIGALNWKQLRAWRKANWEARWK